MKTHKTREIVFRRTFSLIKRSGNVKTQRGFLLVRPRSLYESRSGVRGIFIVVLLYWVNCLSVFKICLLSGFFYLSIVYTYTFYVYFEVENKRRGITFGVQNNLLTFIFTLWWYVDNFTNFRFCVLV